MVMGVAIKKPAPGGSAGSKLRYTRGTGLGVLARYAPELQPDERQFPRIRAALVLTARGSAGGHAARAEPRTNFDWIDMTDFIREVEEEYRRDKAIEAWKRYQNWIIAIAILIVVAAGGWRFYQSQQKAAAEAAGARFKSAVQLGREGKPQDAEQAFLEIARTGPKGYAVLARFRAAAEIAQRNRAEAVTIYDALANDPGVKQVMQNVARLRSAFLLVDTADDVEMKRRIEPLAAPTSPFRHSAREPLGLAAWKADNYEAAGRFRYHSPTRRRPKAFANAPQMLLGAAGPLK